MPKINRDDAIDRQAYSWRQNQAKWLLNRQLGTGIEEVCFDLLK